VKLVLAVLLVMLNEAVMIVVESLAFAFTEPPPETVTVFTCGEAAFAATFTVTVIVG
jgi:hypothetical protein